MERGRLQFEITSDVNGTQIHEHSVSKKASNSLQVILESINEVANLFQESEESVTIDPGTTKISIIGSQDQIRFIERNLTEIAEGNSENDKLTKTIRKLHRTILANSLNYSASIHLENRIEDLTPVFKDKKKFKRSVTPFTRIKFKAGILRGMIDNEEKSNSAVILELDDRERYTIKCSNIDSYSLADLYTKRAYISYWETMKGDKVVARTLCDNYPNTDLYDEIYQLHVDLIRKEGTEKLKYLYKKIDLLISSERSYEKVEKIVKTFNNSDEDISILRMLISALQPAENSKELVLLRKELISKVEDKIGEIY